MNAKKKSDTVLITWHQVTSRFETTSELKLKLKDDLSTFVPDSPDFRVGYMVNCKTQQFILAREDLAVMYSTARDEIYGAIKRMRRNENSLLGMLGNVIAPQHHRKLVHQRF